MMLAMLDTTEVFIISTPGFAIAAAPLALKPYTKKDTHKDCSAHQSGTHRISAGPA